MKNNEDLAGFTLLYTMATLTSATLFLLVMFWIYYYNDGLDWYVFHTRFNWHPFLMTYGICLFSSGIMVYRDLLSRNGSQKKLNMYHAIYHSAFILLIISALYPVISIRIELTIPNVFSLHSWVGIVTILIYLFQWVLGLVALIFPGLSVPVRAAMMPYHVYFGLAAFTLAIATCLMGLTEKLLFTFKTECADMSSESVLVNIVGLMFVIFGIQNIYMVTNIGYKRYRRPNDNVLPFPVGQ